MLSNPKRLLGVACAFLVPTLVVGFGVPALAQSPSSASPSPVSPSTSSSPAAGTSSSGLPGDATAGQQFFAKSTCTTCHGADLSGGIGPRLNPIEHIPGAPANPLDPNYLINTITNGKSGGWTSNMPQKGGDSSLTETQIRDIAAFIIEQNKTAPAGLSPRELAISNVTWITIAILALLVVTWLLARYNMRWVAYRARRR